MRNWTVVLVLCCSLTAVSAQIPFDIKLLSPRSRVESLFKERKFAVQNVPPVEGVAPGMFATNIEWNGTAFDTMFVWFTPTTARATAVSFVRNCDSDKAPLIVAELTDLVSHTYGDPSFSDETSARWERGNEAAISMGPYAENDAVWVRFDLAPLFYRLSTTKLLWPLELPLITDRDEISERIKDSCRKVIEEGDQLFVSPGCSCYGAKARKTSVYLDGLGRPLTLEMVISRADQGAVQSRLQTLYGPPNGLDPSSPSWMMDDQVAVSIADADGGLTVTFNLLTLELLQYMDK